jgi:hypothetical protein
VRRPPLCDVHLFRNGSCGDLVSTATALRSEVGIPVQLEISLFSETSRPAVGSGQSPVQLVYELLIGAKVAGA